MALPIDFITRTRALLGNEFDSFEAALQADVPVSIRINEKKGAPIPAADTPDNRVAWCDTGYYLPERLSFTFDPLFHAGAYYVQEASSMFLEQVIRSHVKTPRPLRRSGRQIDSPGGLSAGREPAGQQ